MQFVFSPSLPLCNFVGIYVLVLNIYNKHNLINFNASTENQNFNKE